MKKSRYNITFYPNDGVEREFNSPTGKTYESDESLLEVIKKWGMEYPDGKFISITKIREDGRPDY